MQKLPTKISTVEEMQRQLDEMELKSLGFSASQNSLMQSMSRPDSFVIEHAHEDDHHYVKYKSTYDIAAGKRRLARLLEEIKQGKHEQLNGQMQGAGKTTIISRTESSKYLTMQSCSRSLIGQPRPPMQMTWQLGVELKAHGSVRLKTLFGEHACFGCQICQGFGHSKSDCLTDSKLKLIRNRQPVYLRIFKLATAALEMKKGIYEENWLYADLLAVACNEQRKSVGKEVGEAANMDALINVLSQELEALTKKRCEYCDGYGHLGSDKAMVRLGKRTRIPTNAKYDHYGRITYITYPDSCPTKHSLERSMLGFSESKSEFVAVIQNHRTRTRELYAQQQQQVEKSDKKIAALASLQAVTDYFKAGVMKPSEDSKGPVSSKNAGQVGKSATEYEEKALARKEKIASVPETEEGRVEQFMDAEDEIALADVALIDLDVDGIEKDKIAQKLVYSTKRWYLQTDIDASKSIDVEKWKDDFSNFLYAYARDQIAGENAIALLIYTFTFFRTGFTGITKNMKKPATDIGLQNLYGMLATNSERTIAAFCVGGSAYRCLHSLHNHVAAKLAAAGKKPDDYKSVKADMLTDWSNPPANKAKQRSRKYFDFYVQLMQSASSKLKSEIEVMEKELVEDVDQDMS